MTHTSDTIPDPYIVLIFVGQSPHVSWGLRHPKWPRKSNPWGSSQMVTVCWSDWWFLLDISSEFYRHDINMDCICSVWSRGAGGESNSSRYYISVLNQESCGLFSTQNHFFVISCNPKCTDRASEGEVYELQSGCWRLLRWEPGKSWGHDDWDHGHFHPQLIPRMYPNW